MKEISTSAGLPKFVREPRLGSTPVAKNRGLRNVEQFGSFDDVKTSEETAFNHQSLTRLNPRQFVKGAVEGEQVFPCPGHSVSGIVDGHDNSVRSASLVGMAATGRFHQHLAHGTGSDAFEVEPRRRCEARGIRQL